MREAPRPVFTVRPKARPAQAGLGKKVSICRDALLARVARAGLDRLQIGDQLGDSCLDRALVVRLGVETCAPYWHVARAVSLDLGATVDEAGDLVLGQRIPETLRKPAQLAGGVVNTGATGPSPSPVSPWHEPQYSRYICRPCATSSAPALAAVPNINRTPVPPQNLVHAN